MNQNIETPLRDTELECAKYRRVMALEAELDVWQLRYKQMTSSYNAVSVERDNLEGCIMQREQQIKSCENALIESHEKCKTQQALIKLRDAQIALNKSAALIAERESKRLIDKAKSQRNACQMVALSAVAMFLLAVFGGGV